VIGRRLNTLRERHMQRSAFSHGLRARGQGSASLRKFGGEGDSQSPLKDRAFSIFLDQNPPLELRPEQGISPVSLAIERCGIRYKGSAICGRLIVEHCAFFAYLLLKQVLTEGCSQHRLMGAWSRNHSSGTVIVSGRSLQRLGHSRHVHCRSAQRRLRHKPPCDKIGAQVAKAISLMSRACRLGCRK
jgi:hypothetical protein